MGVASWLTTLQWQHFTAGFLGVIGTAAVRSIVLAALTGFLLAVFRVKNVALRLAAWKLVLWGALAMPLLVWLLPPVPFVVPSALAAQFARFAPSTEAAAPTPLASSKKATRSSASHAYVPHQTVALREEFATSTAPKAHYSQPLGKPPATSTRPALSSAATAPSPVEANEEAVAPRAAASPALPVAPRFRVSGLAIAAFAYLAMVALLLSRLVIGWTLGRRLIRGSRVVRDPRAHLSLSLRAFPSGLEEPPLLAESDAVTVPVTLGVARPVILLPSDWREWDDHKLNAVLAHELSHIGRNDALTQRVSQLHRAMYWFSPLAWWLDREIARLAEEASDEAALAGGADRERYAETLLGFFEAVNAASGRVWWQGVSMAARGDAAERVDRILSWKGSASMRLQKTLVVALSVVALPALFATASVHFTARADQAPPRPAAKPAPAPALAVAPAPAALAAPAPATAPTPAAFAAPEAVAFAAPESFAAFATVAPIASQEPSQPAPAAPQASPSTPPAPSSPSSPDTPEAPPASRHRQRVIVTPNIHVDPIITIPDVNVPEINIPPMNIVVPKIDMSGLAMTTAQMAHARVNLEAARYAMRHTMPFVVQQSGNASFWVSDSTHVRDPYIVSSGSFFIGVMNHSMTIDEDGDSDELFWAKRLRSRIGGDFIWFEHDGQDYIIRDRAIIDRVVELYKPIRDLQKQQEDLGRQQEELGEQQEKLGSQMEDVTVKIPDMSEDLEHIKQRMRELAAKGGTQSELGDLQSELGELQGRIGEIQSQAGREESRIGRQQGELGRKQGELGRKQGELGRQEGQLSRKVQQQVSAILDESREKKLAQPDNSHVRE